MSISTHTLTWSVTRPLSTIALSQTISTHTLTWSVTPLKSDSFPVFSHFNSHAHVERDHFSRCENCKQLHFNSHAHVERDSFSYIIQIQKKNFNSHAHVERDFICSSTTGNRLAISTHTLTWSVTRNK